MEATQIMQMAADHAATAEELGARGAPTTAVRTEIEFAKLYVTMAREVRIGNGRARTYHQVLFKPVVVHALTPGAILPGEGDEDLDERPDDER